MVLRKSFGHVIKISNTVDRVDTCLHDIGIHTCVFDIQHNGHICST